MDHPDALVKEHPFYNPNLDINSDKCKNTSDVEIDSYPIYIKKGGFVYKKQVSQNADHVRNKKREYMVGYRKRMKEKKNQSE
jgi:hypothetical protein